MLDTAEPAREVLVDTPASEGRVVLEVAVWVVDTPADGRDAWPAGRGRLEATVEVRGAPPKDERLEAADNCFVGDFVGDFFSRSVSQYSSHYHDRGGSRYPNRSSGWHSWCRCRCPRRICALSFDSCRGQCTWFPCASADSALSAGSSSGGGPGALFTLPARLLKHRSHCGWTDKHAKSWLALEVSLALYLTIIFACGVVQFDTDPISNREVSGTDKANGGLSPVSQADDRAR